MVDASAEIAVNEAYSPAINMGSTRGRASARRADHPMSSCGNGDTNFATVIGDVRFLPEDLATTAKKLRPIFERLAKETFNRGARQTQRSMIPAIFASAARSL